MRGLPSLPVLRVGTRWDLPDSPAQVTDIFISCSPTIDSVVAVLLPEQSDSLSLSMFSELCRFCDYFLTMLYFGMGFVPCVCACTYV